MGKLRNVLAMVVLGIIFLYGISPAQDNQGPGPKGGPKGPPPNAGINQQGQQPGGDNPDQQKPGQGNFRRPPQGQGPGPMGPDGLMDNPKVQDEMKRHFEVMKGLLEQIKALQDKIRKELSSKIETLRKQNQPETPPKEQPQKPDEQGNPPAPNKVAPDAGKFKEEALKLLEPYRADAEKIAGQIVDEMVTHQQNLADIVKAEQDNIKKKMTDDILLPPRPRPQWRQGQGKGQRPDGTNRPNGPEQPKQLPAKPDNKPVKPNDKGGDDGSDDLDELLGD